jgi:hypothetical protein
LHRIGVEDDSRVPAAAGNLLHRLNHADLVVHPHHRDNRRPLRQGGIQGVELQESGRAYRQEDLPAAQMTDGVCRGEHRLVLDG